MLFIFIKNVSKPFSISTNSENWFWLKNIDLSEIEVFFLNKSFAVDFSRNQIKNLS